MATTELYSEHAETIEAVLAYTCRAQRLTADGADEFSSWARLRLLEDDCAILRKFQGLSSFKTFLVTVIQRLFLDWRIKEWGKWRPTAETRRLGPIAVELERLVLRDDIDFNQSAQLLVSRGIAATAAECDDIWAQLKRSPRRQRAGADELNTIAVAPADPVEQDDRRRRRGEVLAALRRAMAELPPADRLIVQLRYDDAFTVARIAKTMNLDQKALYRRFEQLWKQLRASLRGAGVSDADVRDLFDDRPDEDFGAMTGNGERGPSNFPNAGGAVA